MKNKISIQKTKKVTGVTIKKVKYLKNHSIFALYEPKIKIV